QRVRDLCRLELPPVQTRLAQRDRGLRGEAREQTSLGFRLAGQLEHQPAAHAVALDERRLDPVRKRLAEARRTLVVEPERNAPGLEERGRSGDRQRADVVE